jgi:hypothetical protein
LIVIVAVVGVVDLFYIYSAATLRTTTAPGLFERPPVTINPEERLEGALFVIGIQNSALAITLLAGYWVVVRWRTRSVSGRLFAVFVAFLLLPVALIAVFLFIFMLLAITGVHV